jgi:hypothetical protein
MPGVAKPQQKRDDLVSSVHSWKLRAARGWSPRVVTTFARDKDRGYPKKTPGCFHNRDVVRGNFRNALIMG